jgi:hypothetical protein
MPPRLSPITVKLFPNSLAPCPSYRHAPAHPPTLLPFPHLQVRTGHLTQDVAVLTRLGDRFSTWGPDNGLKSIIPALLTSGLMGYPFCLPVSGQRVGEDYGRGGRGA